MKIIIAFILLIVMFAGMTILGIQAISVGFGIPLVNGWGYFGFLTMSVFFTGFMGWLIQGVLDS